MELEYDQFDLEEKKRREQEISDPLNYLSENAYAGMKDAKRQFLEIPREIARPFTPDEMWQDIDQEIARTKAETKAMYRKMEQYTEKQNKMAAFALNMGGELVRGVSNPLEMAIKKSTGGLGSGGVGLVVNSIYDVAEYAYENKSLYDRNIFTEFETMDAAQLSGRMLLNGMVAAGHYKSKGLIKNLDGTDAEGIRYKWREEYKEYFNAVSEKDAEFITDYMNKIRNGEKISNLNLKKMDKVSQRNLEKFYNDWINDKIPKLEGPEVRLRNTDVEPSPLPTLPPPQKQLPYSEIEVKNYQLVKNMNMDMNSLMNEIKDPDSELREAATTVLEERLDSQGIFVETEEIEGERTGAIAIVEGEVRYTNDSYVNLTTEGEGKAVPGEIIGGTAVLDISKGNYSREEIAELSEQLYHVPRVSTIAVKDAEGNTEVYEHRPFLDLQMFAKKEKLYQAKVVGGDEYTHTSNVGLMENRENIVKQLNALKVNLDDWTLIKTAKDGKITLIKAPTFDTVSEPTITEWLDLETGNIRKAGKNPQILHRRYSFVNQDYKGFDVEEDKKRYSEYLDPIMTAQNIPKNKIGRREYWDNFLSENPRPGAEAQEVVELPQEELHGIRAILSPLAEGNWLYDEAGYSPEEVEGIKRKLQGVDEAAKGKTNTGNSNKMPKMLSTVIPNVVEKTDRILNHGGGQFAKHHRVLKEEGYEHLYAFDPDPKLQTEEFIAKNGEEYRGVNVLPKVKLDVIVTSNVMNVIPPRAAGESKDGFYLEDYIYYLMEAARETGAERVLVTVYEGDSKNNNKPQVMGGGTWQTNQKTAWYGKFLEPLGFELKSVKGTKYWEWKKGNRLNIQLFGKKKEVEITEETTKEEIAEMTNGKFKGISRMISFDELQDYKEGQVLERLGLSWTDGGEFKPETERGYNYVFRVVNEIPGHAVDYDNEIETEILAAFPDEKEILIPNTAKFRVLRDHLAEDDQFNFDEMGFVEIEVEYINNEPDIQLFGKKEEADPEAATKKKSRQEMTYLERIEEKLKTIDPKKKSNKNLIDFLEAAKEGKTELAEKLWEKLSKKERLRPPITASWLFMNNKEKINYSIAEHTEGDKMEYMQSISTSCVLNKFCQASSKVKDNICSDCYALNMMVGKPDLVYKVGLNTEFYTETDIKPEDVPTFNLKTFRFEAFGELFNVQQFKNYVTIASSPKNRGTNFTIFSKNYPVIIEYLEAGGEIPENFNIILSSIKMNTPMEVPEKLKGIVRGIFTVYDADYVKEHGINVNCQQNCNECRVCYEYLPRNGEALYINELLKRDEDVKYTKTSYDAVEKYGKKSEEEKYKAQFEQALAYLSNNMSEAEWQKYRTALEEGTSKQKKEFNKKIERNLTKFKLDITFLSKYDSYFNTKTTGSEIYDDYMKHPFKLIHENKSFRITHITPKEYLTTVAEAKGVTIEALMETVNKDKLALFVHRMRTNEEFPVPVMDAEKSEGVTRVVAAIILGEQYIPVMRIKELRETFYTQEDINAELEEMNVLIPARETANQQTMSLWKTRESISIADMPQYRAKNLIEEDKENLLRSGDKVLAVKVYKDHDYKRTMKTTFKGKKGSKVKGSSYSTTTYKRDVYVDVLYVNKEGRKGIYTLAWLMGKGLTNVDLEIEKYSGEVETRPVVPLKGELAPLDILTKKTQSSSGDTPPPTDGSINDLSDAGEVARRTMAGQPQGNYMNTVEQDFKLFLKNTHDLYTDFAKEYYDIEVQEGKPGELQTGGLSKYAEGKMKGSNYKINENIIRYLTPMRKNIRLHAAQLEAQNAHELFKATDGEFQLFKNMIYGLSESVDKQQFVEMIQGKAVLETPITKNLTEVMRAKVREYIAIKSGDETAKNIEYAYFTDLVYNKQKYEAMLGNIVAKKDMAAIQELGQYIGKNAKVTETEAFAAGLTWDETKVKYTSIDIGGGNVKIVPVMEYSINDYPVEVVAAFWNSYSQTNKQQGKEGKGLSKWEVGSRYGNEERNTVEMPGGVMQHEITVPAFNNFAESMRGFEIEPYEIMTTIYAEIANEKLGINELKTLLNDLRVNEKEFSRNIVGEEKGWIKTLHQDISESSIKMIEEIVQEAEQKGRYRPNIWTDNKMADPELMTENLLSKTVKGYIGYQLLANLNYIKEITITNKTLANHGAHKLGWEPGFNLIRQLFIEPIRLHAQIASNTDAIIQKNLNYVKTWKDRRFIELYLRKRLENENIFQDLGNGVDNAKQGIEKVGIKAGEIGAKGQFVSDIQRLWQSEMMSLYYMTKKLPMMEYANIKPMLKMILDSNGITQEEFIDLKVKLLKLGEEGLAEKIFNGKVAETREDFIIQSLFEQFKDIHGSEFNPYDTSLTGFTSGLSKRNDGFVGEMLKLYQRYSLGALDRTLEELTTYYDDAGRLRGRLDFDKGTTVHQKFKQATKGADPKDFKLYAKSAAGAFLIMLGIQWLQGKLTGTSNDEIAEAKMAALVEGDFVGLAQDAIFNFAGEYTGAGVVLGLSSPLGGLGRSVTSMYQRAMSAEGLDTVEALQWFATSLVFPQSIARGIDNMKFQRNIPNRLTTASEEAQWQWQTKYRMEAQLAQEEGKLPIEKFNEMILGTAVNWYQYFDKNRDKAEDLTGLKGDAAVVTAGAIMDTAESAAKETAIVEILNDPNTSREEKDKQLKQFGLSFEQQFSKMSGEDKKLFSTFAALVNLQKEDELLLMMFKFSSAKDKNKWVQSQLGEEEYKDLKTFQEGLEGRKDQIKSQASKIKKMDFENYIKYLEILRGM